MGKMETCIICGGYTFYESVVPFQKNCGRCGSPYSSTGRCLIAQEYQKDIRKNYMMYYNPCPAYSMHVKVSFTRIDIEELHDGKITVVLSAIPDAEYPYEIGVSRISVNDGLWETVYKGKSGTDARINFQAVVELLRDDPDMEFENIIPLEVYGR